jgi:hypothetical protein
MDTREHKTLENRPRREAKRKGLLLRRNRTRDRSTENYGLYVLIGNSRGNRLPGAAASTHGILARRGRHLGKHRQGAGELPLVKGKDAPRPFIGARPPSTDRQKLPPPTPCGSLHDPLCGPVVDPRCFGCCVD